MRRFLNSTLGPRSIRGVEMKYLPRVLSTVTGLCTLVTIFAAQSVAIQYTYDNLNRLVRVEYDNGATIDYTYDAAGNRLQKVIAAEDGCLCDFDTDNDVDGSDLAAFIKNGIGSGGPDLSAMGDELGKTDCP